MTTTRDRMRSGGGRRVDRKRSKRVAVMKEPFHDFVDTMGHQVRIQGEVNDCKMVWVKKYTHQHGVGYAW